MEIVETTLGKISGEIRDGVRIFRGIPYGTVDERFMPPRPADSWNGIRSCTKNGPVAMQNASGSISGDPVLGPHFNGGEPEKFGVADEVQSEDCLVLNVLTSGLEGKRPVLVYLHGGGFATGSGTLAIGSDRLVREQNMVLVSVNHRLNAFGYLYLGHLDERYKASGAAGMLDLVLALEWIRDNIAGFGGNPENVTIMGESGGGAKVCLLLEMASAKGLFHKAILISGMFPVGTRTKAKSAEETNELLKIMHTDLEGLVHAPAQRILDAQKSLSLRWEPTADGDIIPVNPDGKYVPTRFGDGIPKLFGSSEDEFGVFMPIERIRSVTWENIESKLAEMDIHTDVEAWRRINNRGDEAAHTFLKIISMGNPLGYSAYGQALAECAGSAVYQYVMRYDSPLPSDNTFRCAWHTAELPLQMRVVLHKESEELSRIFSAAIGAFIRNGNPSTVDRPWPCFEKEKQIAMVFDENVYPEPGYWKKIPVIPS